MDKEVPEEIQTLPDAWNTPEVKAWQRELAELQAQLNKSEGKRIYAHLTSYLRTVEAWRLFAASLSRLLHKCEHNDQMKIYVMSNFNKPDPRDSIISALDSSLVAYAAGVGAVVDQTRELVDKFGDKRLKQEFELRKKLIEEAVPAAPFIIKLRNYVLHYLAAPWGITLQVENKEDKQEETFRIQLSRDDLLQMKDWTGPARKFLERQEERIHITPLIDAFTQAEYDMAAWAHNSVQDLHQAAIDEANELMRRYNLCLTRGAYDGSDMEEFKQHLSENMRRKDNGEEQLDWREVKAGRCALANSCAATQQPSASPPR